MNLNIISIVYYHITFEKMIVSFDIIDYNDDYENMRHIKNLLCSFSKTNLDSNILKTKSF